MVKNLISQLLGAEAGPHSCFRPALLFNTCLRIKAAWHTSSVFERKGNVASTDALPDIHLGRGSCTNETNSVKECDGSLSIHASSERLATHQQTDQSSKEPDRKQLEGCVCQLLSKHCVPAELKGGELKGGCHPDPCWQANRLGCCSGEKHGSLRWAESRILLYLVMQGLSAAG